MSRAVHLSPAQARLLREALGSQSFNVGDLNITAVNGAAYTDARRLAKRGLLEKLGRGKYRVTEPGLDALRASDGLKEKKS